MALAGCHGGLGAVKKAEERAIGVQPLSKSGCHLYTTWSPPVCPPQTLGTQRSAVRQLATFALLLFVLPCFALLCSSWHSFAFPSLLSSAVLAPALPQSVLLFLSWKYFAFPCATFLCSALPSCALPSLALLCFALWGHAFLCLA